MYVETPPVLGKTWEAIGPFPSGMREHPFMASPLSALRGDIDPDIAFARAPYGAGSFPSELCDGGRAGWATFSSEASSDKSGKRTVDVSYPTVRWDQLRTDKGWASLQYQALLRTSLKVPDIGEPVTPLLFDISQAAEYTIVPDHEPTAGPSDPETDPIAPTWYNADVYDFASSPFGTNNVIPGKASNFSRALSLKPGRYTLLVRALYEIRMFGDPGPGKIPVIHLKAHVALDNAATFTGDSAIELVTGLKIVPDLVDGWFMGSWMSVGVRVPSSSRGALVLCATTTPCEGLSVTSVRQGRIVPGQTRSIAFKINQTRPIHLDGLNVQLRLETMGGVERAVTWCVPLVQRSTTELPPFRMSFASPFDVPDHGPSLVSLAMVVPPRHLKLLPTAELQKLPPVILALHGAGVHVESEFWTGAMPNVAGGWAVLPSGKNEWGEDWHGGSMNDVWAARSELAPTLSKLGIAVSSDTILLGHSNGGQGAWHAAARYPDRIVGLIAVSGWLKIQDYVPYTELYSHHYADPALMGILLASLTPYNNDLYASNLSSVPILALHGGDDDNVPPRHGRSHVALVSSWAPNGNIKFVEVPARGHWWEGVLKEPCVAEFILGLPPKKSHDEIRKTGFTLTTANPIETGSIAGIQIREVIVPGRLARLDVNAPQWRDGSQGSLDLHGSNIRRIEITTDRSFSSLTCKAGKWEETKQWAPRACGPMIRLLATSGPFTLIIPENNDRILSLATRYAHDLTVYHRVDSHIVYDHEALSSVSSETLSPGSVVIFGRPDENQFSKWLLSLEKIPLKFSRSDKGYRKKSFIINNREVFESSSGIISTHPHPMYPHLSVQDSLAVIVAGTDDDGLELAARLLPVRTGVPVPEWVAVSARTKWQGAGGVIGAGFWDGNWQWSECMTWMDRVE